MSALACERDQAESPQGLHARNGQTNVDAAHCLDLIYRVHRKPLYRYLLRLNLGDRREAEDLLQETLLRVWRYLQDHTLEEATLWAWLCTIARHLSIDSARARLARPIEATKVDPSTFAGSDNPIERMLVVEAVRKSLVTLSPEHRAILFEVFYRDCSVKEAAVLLQIPEGTVKSRTYYALRALREAIAAADHEGRLCRSALP
jgi:RNA polymerase sigma-70 factor (ECF subfamily)